MDEIFLQKSWHWIDWNGCFEKCVKYLVGVDKTVKLCIIPACPANTHEAAADIEEEL